MRWRRVRPGVYVSGAYEVGQMECGEWYADGPGVDAAYPSKAHAQAACVQAGGGAKDKT